MYAQASLGDRISAARSSSEDRKEQIYALEELLEDSLVHLYPDTLGLIHYAIAFRYRILQDHHKVIDHSEQGVDFFESIDYRGYQYAYLLSFLGESYEAINREKASLDAYFDILKRVPEGRDIDVYGYAVNEIARKFIQYQDYESALNVIDKFFNSSYRHQVGSMDLIHILLSSSIANSNLKGGEYLKKAQDDIQEALALNDALSAEGSDMWISLKMQEAAISLFSEQPEVGKQYEQLLKRLVESEDTGDIAESAATVAFNASFAYQKMQDYTSAIKLARIAQVHFGNYGDVRYLETEYLIYDNLATSFLGVGQIDSARYYIERGIGLFPLALEVDPSHRKHLLNLLYDKARIYERISQQLPAYGDSALQVLYTLDQLMDLHINEQLSEYSIRNLKRLGSKYYRLAIDIAYQMKSNSAFWHFAEKNKGLYLLNAHIKRRNMREVSQSASAIDSIRRYVSLQQHVLLNLSEDDPRSITIQKSISDAKSHILLMQREYVESSPISIQPEALAAMVDHLVRDELVLQYQYGRHDLYVQIVSNAGSQTIKCGPTDSINLAIQHLRGLLRQRDSKITTIDHYSAILYEYLINPALSDRSEITIIPDGDLFFLPFEVLHRQGVDAYLIEDYDIAYTPSGSFLLVETPESPAREITIFQPTYETDAALTPPLPFIDSEIEAISNRFDVRILDRATEKNFLIDAIQQGWVVHFGGHAIINGSLDEQSYLALGSKDDISDRLLLGELYTIQSQADLVTLSACNTGLGTLMDGEGVSSLTRGFLYSGARAVVNTLWTVDDQSTSHLIGHFYNSLSHGATKTRALRDAKLSYLQSAESYQRHPYYWAGIIGMGDMGEALVFPIRWGKVGLTLLLIVILGIFLTWRFSNKPMKKIEFLSDWG